MTPKFKHDCNGCKFLGHFLGYDVYVCPHGTSLYTNLIARWGNEGHEYASNELENFQKMMRERTEKITGIEIGTMAFQDFVFSPQAIDYHRAWLLALATNFTV